MRETLPVDENYKQATARCTPWETSSGSPSLARFRWKGTHRRPPERLACRRIPPRELSYEFIRFRNSFIGKTEEQLTEEGVPYEGWNGFFSRNWPEADSRRHHRPPETSFRSSTKELLGVHIIGEGASELLTSGSVFALQGTVEYLWIPFSISDTGEFYRRRIQWSEQTGQGRSHVRGGSIDGIFDFLGLAEHDA